MIRLSKKLALLTILFITLGGPAAKAEQASPESSPEASAQRILNEVVDGTNTFNEEKILSTIASDASMISKNGEVVLSKAGIQDYFSRMVKGKAILKKMTSVARFSQKPVIEGNTLIWLGDSDDHYEFSSGLDLKIKTVFTSVFLKESDGWKIRHIHFGFNVWDYPILSTASFSLSFVPWLIFFTSFLITFLILYYRQKILNKKSALLVSVALVWAFYTIPFSGATEGFPEFNFTQALSEFWRDPSLAHTHPDFVSITNAGEATQGLEAYLKLTHRPIRTELEHLVKVSSGQNSFLILGTVKETFTSSEHKEQSFIDQFSAVFVRSEVNHVWELAAYQTSSDLFDNPNLKAITLKLWLRCAAAVLLGMSLAWAVFKNQSRHRR